MYHIAFISFLVFVTSSLVYGVLIIAGLDLPESSSKSDCFGSLFIGVQSKSDIIKYVRAGIADKAILCLSVRNYSLLVMVLASVFDFILRLF